MIDDESDENEKRESFERSQINVRATEWRDAGKMNKKLIPKK